MVIHDSYIKHRIIWIILINNIEKGLVLDYTQGNPFSFYMDEKQQVFNDLITLPYGEINQFTFKWIIFTPEEQWQILVIRYFSWNVFWILNILGRSIKSIRTIIRPDSNDHDRYLAWLKLDELETIFDEVEQLLSLFPKE